MDTKLVKGIVGCIAVLAVFVLIQGCASQEKSLKTQDQTKLTHNELVTLFSVPQEATLTNSRGMYSLKYTPDGGQTISGGSTMDSGTYRFVEDTICGKWTNLRKGLEKCASLYRDDEKSFELIYTDGRNAGILKFK